MISRIQLHSDSPTFSRLVWGAYRIANDPERREIAHIARMVDTCLDAGITTIDHADIYGGYRVEALFGEMLASRPDLRNRIELVTKCGIALVSPARPDHHIKHYNSTPEHIRQSLENSLRNLKVDHIDLLLLHRPDPLLDAAEVAGVLETLVAEGKTRAVGVSNYTPSQFALLQSKLSIPLVANQIELSVSHTAPLHDGTLDDCQRLGVLPMAWSPLAGGRLFDPEKGNPRLCRATDRSLGPLQCGWSGCRRACMAAALALQTTADHRFDRPQTAAGANARRRNRARASRLVPGAGNGNRATSALAGFRTGRVRQPEKP